jgi:hypothetical protein
MIFNCGRKGLTRKEVLEMIGQRIDDGERVEEILESLVSEKISNDNFDRIIDSKTDRDRYFFKKEGNLEILTTPYQTKKSLEEGIDDLMILTNESIDKIEGSGEGCWVFDNENSIWYSLGGKDNLSFCRVRHEFVDYDLSRLGKDLRIFHIHPKMYEFVHNSISEKYLILRKILLWLKLF